MSFCVHSPRKILPELQKHRHNCLRSPHNNLIANRLKPYISYDEHIAFPLRATMAREPPLLIDSKFVCFKGSSRIFNLLEYVYLCECP